MRETVTEFQRRQESNPFSARNMLLTVLGLIVSGIAVAAFTAGMGWCNDLKKSVDQTHDSILLYGVGITNLQGEVGELKIELSSRPTRAELNDKLAALQREAVTKEPKMRD
jgi:hypothetical protein